MHRSHRRNPSSLFPFILVALAACAPDAPIEADGDVAFAPDLHVEVEAMEERPSGLLVQDVRVGEGREATEGDIVAVHYTGWLPNGREFDSSVGGDPFEFRVGGGQVISGWDEGVAGMREGGLRRLVLPPTLAYGSSGAGGVIPPNATLLFDVELLAIE